MINLLYLKFLLLYYSILYKHFENRETTYGTFKIMVKILQNISINSPYEPDISAGTVNTFTSLSPHT